MPREVKSILSTIAHNYELGVESKLLADVWVTCNFLIFSLSILIIANRFNKSIPFEYYVTPAMHNEDDKGSQSILKNEKSP